MAIMPGYNIALTAKWAAKEELKYRVTIKFSKANITKEKAEDEVTSIVGKEKYFEITEDDDEIIVIISYDNENDAEDFIKDIKRNISESFIMDYSGASTLQMSAFLAFLFFII